MRLTAIRLHNVRSFAGRGIAIDAIGEGVNVLAEANEYGKSTIFDAVHALFFQSHKGKGGAIKALQPYSGGSITVEAEVETPEGRFHLRKRWLSKAQATVADAATGRLIAQADEADRWIDARMRGGAAGPAGLLWVQQGAVEMGKGGGKAGEAEKAAREDVLTSVSGEIEALTGGRRMAQVLAKCSAELDPLVTATGRQKAGGPYAAALQHRDELQARRDELDGIVNELRGHLDQRATARRRLADLQEADTAEHDRHALAAATKALIDAEAQAEKLERAELAERLARQEQQAASEALAGFEKALAGIAALKTRIDGEAAVFTEATEKRDRGRAARDTAAEALGAADEALRRADAALTAARKADLARAAAARLSERRQTLTGAETAAREADEARAQATALDVPKADLTRLDGLTDEVATLTAEQRASSASIRIAYAGPDAPRIRRDGAVVPDDEPMAIEGTARFDIDGVGALTVSSGAGSASGAVQQNLARARQGLADLLTKIGVPTPDAARTRARKADGHRHAADLATTRLETLAPKGLDALRTEVAALAAQAEEMPESAEPVETLAERHRLAGDARARAEAQRDAAQTALNTLERGLVESETNLARSREALQRDETAAGEGGDPDARRAALTQASAETARAFDVAKSAADALRAQTPDLITLRAAKARAESVLTRSRAETESLGRTISELDGRIGTRAEQGVEEELAEVEGRLSRAADHVAGLETEIAALQRLKTVLTDARAQAKEHFFEPVMAELRPLLSLVFGDAVVTFDETTLLPVSVERGGEVEKFDVLSGGMREQITILTRLAFARLLAQDGRTVPVILDDALIYSDDARIERMFDALHRQATDLQILVFTCRQRAFRALGGREMQVAAWSPEDG